MEYMVVWLHDFTDTYYSVHGLDQIDDAEAFYQKLATNNPNIFSCLGKVEIVEQQFTSSPIFDGLPRPSNDRASGTEEDDSVDWVKRRLIQGQAVGKAVCMAVWLLGRGSFYRIREFEHVEDAVAFFLACLDLMSNPAARSCARTNQNDGYRCSVQLVSDFALDVGCVGTVYRIQQVPTNKLNVNALVPPEKVETLGLHLVVMLEGNEHAALHRSLPQLGCLWVIS